MSESGLAGHGRRDAQTGPVVCYIAALWLIRGEESMHSSASDHSRRLAAVVEHVRAVHLSLIAASASLLLVVSSAQRSSNDEAALRQLSEIQQLERLWTPSWVVHAGTARDESWNCPLSKREVAEAKSKVADEPYAPQLKFLCSAKSLSTQFICAVTDNFEFNTYDISVPIRAGQHLWQAQFPKTLREFRDWWNMLLEPKSLWYSGPLVAGWLYPGTFVDYYKRPSGGGHVILAQPARPAIRSAAPRSDRRA